MLAKERNKGTVPAEKIMWKMLFAMLCFQGNTENIDAYMQPGFLFFKQDC